MITAFSLIAQSLRNGEPMHQVLPSSLVNRVFYHSHHGHTTFTSLTSLEYSRSNVQSPVQTQRPDLEHMKSLDYMYYASGVVAIFHLLVVSLRVSRSVFRVLIWIL